MDQSELKHNLVPLEVGEEYQLRRDLKVRAFRTYHVIPSQGYVIYSVKQKLKQEFIGLPGSEIKQLKLSGVEITNTVSTPEIAFTGDRTSDFILDPDNADVLGAKNSCCGVFTMKFILATQIASQSDKLGNKAILLIHFSARYTTEVG
ncbi:hypothetical protein HU200_067339 [Digitaria exilis]|uniref:Uncharacterized protein n=1 Tax=Digitaria exilis TaxID=1010633 RepID=A0A834ZVQ7_9POAL|nr:hypothetical protein HU200_067339 [Digitaria exilis]